MNRTVSGSFPGRYGAARMGRATRPAIASRPKKLSAHGRRRRRGVGEVGSDIADPLRQAARTSSKRRKENQTPNGNWIRDGERTRPRVLFPAPSPETFCVRRSRSQPNVFGEGAEDDTRGRVCSPTFSRPQFAATQTAANLVRRRLVVSWLVRQDAAGVTRRDSSPRRRRQPD